MGCGASASPPSAATATAAANNHNHNRTPTTHTNPAATTAAPHNTKRPVGSSSSAAAAAATTTATATATAPATTQELQHDSANKQAFDAEKAAQDRGNSIEQQKHMRRNSTTGMRGWGALAKQVKGRAAFGLWTKAKREREARSHEPQRGAVYLSSAFFSNASTADKKKNHMNTISMIRESLIKKTRRFVYTATMALEDQGGLDINSKEGHSAVMSVIDKAQNFVILLTSSLLKTPANAQLAALEFQYAQRTCKRIIICYISKLSIKKMMAAVESEGRAHSLAQHIVKQKEAWIDFSNAMSPTANTRKLTAAAADHISAIQRTQTLASTVTKAAIEMGGDPVEVFEKQFALPLANLNTQLDMDISAIKVYQAWCNKASTWQGLHNSEKVEQLMSGDELAAFASVMESPAAQGQNQKRGASGAGGLSSSSSISEEDIPELPKATLAMRQMLAASQRYDRRHERDTEDAMKIFIVDCANVGDAGSGERENIRPLNVLRRIRDSSLLSYEIVAAEGLYKDGVRAYRVYWPPATVLDVWIVDPLRDGKVNLVSSSIRKRLFEDADGILFLANVSDSWTRLSKYVGIWIDEAVRYMHIRDKEAVIFSRGDDNSHEEEVEDRDAKAFPNALEESGSMSIPVVPINDINVCKMFNKFCVRRCGESFYRPGLRTPAELWVGSLDVWHCEKHRPRILDMSMDAKKKLTKVRKQPIEIYHACVAGMLQVPKVMFNVWSARQKGTDFDPKIDLFLNEFELLCQWLGAFHNTFVRVGITFPDPNDVEKRYLKIREKSKKSAAERASFKAFAQSTLAILIDKELWPRIPRLTRTLVAHSRESLQLPKPLNIALEKQTMIKGIKDKNVLRILDFLGSKTVAQARKLNRAFRDTITKHKQTQRHLRFFDDIRICAARISQVDLLTKALLQMDALAKKTQSLAKRVKAHANVAEQKLRAQVMAQAAASVRR